jgi:hypothetical protein
MAGDSPGSADHPLAPVVSTAVTAGTLLVAFGLLALGVEWFWVAFPIGFGGVLPVALSVLQYRDTGETGQDETDPALADLQARYVRGTITEDEFERRVERVLEAGPARTPAVERRTSQAADK